MVDIKTFQYHNNFFGLSLSHVHLFLASGTAGGDGCYDDGDESAKRPMTEEEKQEQVRRSECTNY